MAQRDLFGRLVDAGEEAIQRLGEAPGADRFLGVANNLRDRMDEMQKRLRGLDAMERRIATLERRLDELAGTKGGSGAAKPARRSGAKSESTAPAGSTARAPGAKRRSSTSKRSPAPKKPPGQAAS